MVFLLTSRSRLWLLPIFLLILSTLIFYTTPARADEVQASLNNFGSAATIDSEGALIVLGNTASFSNGQSQEFFFKFSPTGQRLCMRTFGQGEPLDTFGYSVTTDSSDNIYITGTTQTFGGEDYDVFLQAFTSSCNPLYSNVLQWAGQGNDIARGIAADSALEIYVTGSTTSFAGGLSQIFLLKYTTFDSELQFSKTWGGVRGNDYGSGVAVDNLGDEYVVGTTTSFGAGQADVVLLKYDSSGNLLFQRTWGTGPLNNYGTGVAVDSGGDIYVTGYTYGLGPNPGTSAVILLKYDQSGNLLFQKTWGGIENDFGTGITVDLDGNVYVTGYTKSYSINAGVPSAFLLKYDQVGNLLFQRIWGGNRGDFAYAVGVDIQENAYVTGYTYSFGPNDQGANFFFLKYDSSGNLVLQKLYGGGIPDP